MLDKARPSVSVIIKAFNEQRHIATAVESALAALADLDGEVILADGASTDRTIAIAQNYPIRIVRLDDAADRSCGAGAQLGFQYSRGKFLCLMDGDMRLHAEFPAAAIRYLEEHPEVAGVGGAVIDRDLDNLEYVQRVKRFDPDRRPGVVTRLNGSGLYRRTAIEAAGYLTDRNLHGGEELELAARLQTAGWTLARIPSIAVDHYGHTGSPYALLLRRIMTRNAFGPGEIVRASIGRPHFWFIVRHDKNFRICFLVFAWWATIAGSALLANGSAAWAGVAGVVALPFVAMSLRWRSIRNGIYSVAVWNVHALCFLPGFVRSRTQPADWLASQVIADQVIADQVIADHVIADQVIAGPVRATNAAPLTRTALRS
jgi:glycosyltransferase involved in cell wall biosynthesis